MSLLDNIINNPNYRSFMRKLIHFGTIVVVIGLIRYLVNGDTSILIPGFGIWAIRFFLKAYEHPLDKPGKDTPSELQSFDLFAHKIFWWGASALTIAILFTLCHWAGYLQLLIIGLIAFVSGLVLKLRIKNTCQ